MASDPITIWDRRHKTQAGPSSNAWQRVHSSRNAAFFTRFNSFCVHVPLASDGMGGYIADMTNAAQTDAAIAAAAADAAPMPILVAPHAVLRRKTRTVRPEDMADIRRILPSMFSAMYEAPGIGLAAPQVGLDLRFALVDLGEPEAREPIIMINPEILAETETLAAREEGCLSLPNQYAEVTRPEQVRVQWRTVDGELMEREVDGLLATCMQHEIDHLEGILFVDHLSTLRRNMILRRLAKEQKQKRS